MLILKLRIHHFLFFSLLFTGFTIQAQSLSRKEQTETIDAISLKLRENYLFPEIADKMAESLARYQQNGKYKEVADPDKWAKILTADLQEVSKDKHLQVVYNPKIIARERSLTDEDRANEETAWNTELIGHLKRDNFGFREVKILKGNVGYLNLTEFTNPKYGGETLAAAMKFLENTEAMIIDLRKNDGGFPGMVQLLASYFFNEPVHLADHYNRPKNELTPSWSLPYVEGKQRPDVDLYILTSHETFSAAEAFTYQMQQLKRARVIGERTAGGAHLTGSVIVTDKFSVRIPQGRTTSPVTGADWEGSGIQPDIEIGADQALDQAINEIGKKVSAYSKE